jgi:trans-aconitate methyltransferase
MTKQECTIKKLAPTKRIQNNHLMSPKEKKDFEIIIRRMPWLYNPILNALHSNASTDFTLMDVACGDGYLLELISKKFPLLKLMGLDISSYFVKQAKAKYKFNISRLNVWNLKKDFDIVTCNLSLHHFDNPEKLIKHLLKHTKKVLIVSDQIRPTTEQELESRLEKRKKIIGKSDTPFYKEKERSSILEAYNKNEIERVVKKFRNFEGLSVHIKFSDDDYYERFVAELKK